MAPFDSATTARTNTGDEQKLQIKNIILKAWRERWTDVQWGIHAKTVLGKCTADDVFVAESILQQALNGPGPNSMVLSYLMHSLFSQVISMASLLKSISQYEGYHKPFCIMSLLNLLDSIKDRLIQDDLREGKCLELGISLSSIIHWLLTCMYYSLENLSDLTEFPSDSEDAKIVKSCKTLIMHLMSDPYVESLIYVSVLGETVLFHSIKRMNKEIEKFQDGHYSEEILAISLIMKRLESRSDEEVPSESLYKSLDGKKVLVVNACIQSTLMAAALLKLSTDISKIGNEILVIKRLKNISNTDIFCDIIHSTMVGLVDSLGKDYELRFIGFTFLQLPALLEFLKENLNDSKEDLARGLELFIANESTLEIIDSKLHCHTLELLLTSLQKSSLISGAQKQTLLSRKGSSHIPSKANSSNVVIILKAEATLLSVLKTLDGDYAKNQDAILSVLSDMLGKSFDLILTAASATGRLYQVMAKLIKLNQCSRQVVGEAGKASTARAMIFDISFLMLCNIVQQYGHKMISNEATDCFFEDWRRDCMVEENTAKDPAIILARCDPAKVDLLLSQYLQGDSELKTSLVFWHELCTNSVGVVRELLLAWESDISNFTEVQKVLDIFRSRICCLPICISAWLCAYIQVAPEERCVKARQMLKHLISPITTSDEPQDNFLERQAMMFIVIDKMVNCIQPTASSTSSPSESISRRKHNSQLFKHCWNRMSVRGIVDVETTANLKHLLETNGPVHFVSVCVDEMIELQHSMDLAQWRDMLYGIFHIDLEKCTKSLLSCVLPACLQLSARNPNFVEPQIVALVSLTIDSIISCYHHMNEATKDEKRGQSHSDEPAKKKRKLESPVVDSEKTEQNGIKDLEIVLTAMYTDFSKTLSARKETGPQAIFVLKFIEEFMLKTPNVALLHFLPIQILDQLISLNTKIHPKLLVGVIDLSNHVGRQICARSICTLKQVGMAGTDEAGQSQSQSQSQSSDVR